MHYKNEWLWQESCFLIPQVDWSYDSVFSCRQVKLLEWWHLCLKVRRPSWILPLSYREERLEIAVCKQENVLKSLGIECDQTFPKLDKTSVWHHGTEHEQYLFLHCVDVSPQEPHSCMFWLKRQGKGTGICCGTTGAVAGNSWFFSTMVLAWYLWAKGDSQPELLQTSAQVHVAQRSQLKRTCF